MEVDLEFVFARVLACVEASSSDWTARKYESDQFIVIHHASKKVDIGAISRIRQAEHSSKTKPLTNKTFSSKGDQESDSEISIGPFDKTDSHGVTGDGLDVMLKVEENPVDTPNDDNDVDSDDDVWPLDIDDLPKPKEQRIGTFASGTIDQDNSKNPSPPTDGATIEYWEISSGDEPDDVPDNERDGNDEKKDDGKYWEVISTSDEDASLRSLLESASKTYEESSQAHQQDSSSFTPAPSSSPQSIEELPLPAPGQRGKPLRRPELAQITFSADGFVHCPYCQSKFANHLQFRRHVYNNHGNYSCNTCDMTFRASFEWKRHLDLVHNDGKGQHLCSECGQRFYMIGHFERHTAQHLGNPVRPLSFKCSLCGSQFPFHFALMTHFQDQHPDELLNCGTCSKPLMTDADLRNHMMGAHPDDKLLIQCPHCWRQFGAQKSLEYHLDENHEDINDVPKLFVCAVGHCQRRFRQAGFLALHASSHEAYGGLRRPYNRRKPRTTDAGEDDNADSDQDVEKAQCPICGRLVKAAMLEVHVKKHQTHTCPECNKSFSSKYYLKEHRLSKHLNVRFTCPLAGCGKSLASRTVLKSHMDLMHGDRQRHQCGQCDKSFSMRHDLAAHVRGSHEGKKVRCSYCGNEFNRVSDRNRHERDVHGKSEGKM